ncbi:bifunctional RNA-binding domain superfamily/YbiA-like superfamily/Forkhead-associated (FHA) domain/RNA polymerase Rpc34/NADAR/RNA recognition motif domain/SMAD-FHA domain superfamily/Winged helix DNA-binding domain superfamily/RNA polymerase Rpc34-like/Nucleotide-binding alpha-beta plait domain superfamily/Winged helix-like DNA-binding domain superfamily [Babesia duncani]|uniref:Uncharacterized protein n=1 Tax=Babesia duncani TaxID=323732 RepID=A0AAD9PJM5_9APIC|nr:bifunctional RNA-binding domain superfamily/YbiA-like superfamily/Forkhead-associated (FHA) domain/RNA polymerase Rpc34/NADAR/RNA recognition motif domain/SMAD-FHA domain superfamily/Winged helix DNA-binding domain superfamily/RNA polymerase Rpc34-like/Nucleotide-binding alpha-beta plait domain superfamily/Winged helix-like DNA-binding domain superfamily [Babesia duncani]
MDLVNPSDELLLKAAFMRIDNFIGEYDFLDIGYKCDVKFKGFVFPSLLHCLHFAKHAHEIHGRNWSLSNDSFIPDDGLAVARKLAKCEPLELLKLFASDNVNRYWNEFRLDWVESMIRDRYRRNAALRQKLCNTGDRDIVYRLDDLFLGSVGTSGQNQLGRLTGKVRKEITQCTDHLVWLAQCENMGTDVFELILEENANGNVTEHPLEGKCCYTIGRHLSCDFKPLNPSISRVHASIYLDRNYGGKFQYLKWGKMLQLGTSKRTYRIMLNYDPAERHAQKLREKKNELNKRAAIKHREIESELETLLHGGLEVMVTNLGFKTKRGDLSDYFGTCGEIDSIILPQDRRSFTEDPSLQESDDAEARGGVAFITFRDKFGAAKAIEKDGSFLNYRRIHVKYRRNFKWKQNSPKRPRSPSLGGRTHDRDIPQSDRLKRPFHSIVSEQLESLKSNYDFEARPKPIQKPRKVTPKPVITKRQSTRDTFISLLQGDFGDANSKLTAAARERQENAKNHVMKCRGGFNLMELTKDEKELARNLALGNGNKFTFDLLKANITKFRNILQPGVAFTSADFTRVLKCLCATRLYGIHNDGSGRQYAALRDPSTVDKLNALQPPDYSVYCTIETAGNRGVWTADIRKATGLLIHQVQRSVKALCDGRGLIKPVTDIHHKNRKLYMLSELDPAIEITGGSFYVNGEFHEQLVEHIQEQIGAFLVKNQGSTIHQIAQHLKSSGKLVGELLQEDVLAIVNSLVFEDKVYSATVAQGQTIYIWAGGSSIQFVQDALLAPCFKCPVQNQCRLGGLDPVCPTNCQYLDALFAPKQA